MTRFTHAAAATFCALLCWPTPVRAAAPREVYEAPEMLDAMVETPAVYPEQARNAGIQGTVLLKVRVEKDGRPSRIIVLKSIPQLDRAAVAAVRQWRFKPAMLDGRPLVAWVAVPVKFTLH